MIHDTLTIVILLLYTAVNFGVVNSEMLVASFSGSSVINASLSPSAESFIPVDSDINLALLAWALYCLLSLFVLETHTFSQLSLSHISYMNLFA